MNVSPCSVVSCLLRFVSLCVFMLRHVPLHIRVCPETRQRLQRLRTRRHLNLGSWLRVLTDEALEEQKTTDGQRPREGKAGACSQADISDRERGQLAIPLDGPGGRVSGVERSQDLSANVPNGPVDSGSNRGIQWGE